MLLWVKKRNGWIPSLWPYLMLTKESKIKCKLCFLQPASLMEEIMTYRLMGNDGKSFCPIKKRIYTDGLSALEITHQSYPFSSLLDKISIFKCDELKKWLYHSVWLFVSLSF